MKKLLNIILLTYNKLENTKKCIENIFKYTNKDFNLIILDNDSEDDTTFFLQKLEKENKNIIVKYNKENIGIIKGRNLGYKVGKRFNTDLIFFIDNDQYCQEGWLESYLEFFENGYEIVGKEAWLMREVDFYPYKRLKDKEESEYFNYVGCGALMIKSSVIEDISLFDERFDKYYFEDPDFSWTAYKAGYKVGWNYNKVIEHNKHNLSLSGERKIMFMKNWQRFRDKWNGSKVPVFKVE